MFNEASFIVPLVGVKACIIAWAVFDIETTHRDTFFFQVVAAIEVVVPSPVVIKRASVLIRCPKLLLFDQEVLKETFVLESRQAVFSLRQVFFFVTSVDPTEVLLASVKSDAYVAYTLVFTGEIFTGHVLMGKSALSTIRRVSKASVVLPDISERVEPTAFFAEIFRQVSILNVSA